MIKFCKLTILLVCIFATSNIFSQATQDVVIPTDVELLSNPYSIKISFKRKTKDIKPYLLSRKDMDGNKWITVKVLNNPIISYTDKNVEEGKAYEYKISTEELAAQSGQKYSYFIAGSKIPTSYKSGGILFVIDSTNESKLKVELEMYYTDLISEGWNLHKLIIPNSMNHIELRQKIKSWYNGYKHEHKTVLLFGKIPVPYSGNFTSTYAPPDAHIPQHCGAWPADVYYSEVSTENWTDNTITNKESATTRLHNIIGDKKFDQRIIPAAPVLNIGRVDMSNLPLIGDEITLLKRYIQKAHDFRTAKIRVKSRAIMQDRFGKLGGEYPAQMAFISANSLFNDSNVKNTTTWLKDVTNKSNNALFSHIASAGHYRGMNAIVTTENLDTPIYTVFNSTFGSYFGDYDVNNAFMRAMIAGPGYSIMSCWNGRPSWMFHHLNMGKTVGYCTNLSQKNGVIDNNYYGGFRPGHTHTALMGDPSLKLHIVNPVNNAQVEVAKDKKSATISWDKSVDSDNVGYIISACNTKHGNYIVLTQEPITENEYMDINPFNGDNYFMVRAVSLTKTPSTSYYNLSSGIILKAADMIGNYTIDKKVIIEPITVYPTPAKDILTFKGITKNTQISIIDIQGKIVLSTILNPLKNTLNIRHLKNGIYMLSMNVDGIISTEKISILK